MDRAGDYSSALFALFNILRRLANDKKTRETRKIGKTKDNER